MARIDFPSNPSDGQTLTVTVAGANTVYTYNATYGVWRATGSIATSSSSGASVTTSNTAPSGPSSGDLWWNSMDGNMYVYYNDGDSNQWVQSNPAQPGPTGPTGPSGEVARSELDAYLQIANLSSLSTSIVPSANVTFDLGSQDKSWKDLYLSGNTIFLGTSQITLNANGGIDLPAGSRTGGTAIGTGSGGGASVTISDTAPGSPSAGDLWWSANTSELFIYYNDTDTSQWVQATTPGATGPAGADGADGSSVTSYANSSIFPSSGNSVGDFAFATNTKAVYIWDGAEWDRISAGADESPIIVTEPVSSVTLPNDGSTSTVTMLASDPEGFDITYGIAYNNAGSNLPSQLSSATTVNSNGVYTFTPSSNTSHAGNFKARLSASDGAKTTTRLVDFSLGFNPTITYIMYGGGGGGGAHYAGGGGAGGLIDQTSSTTTLVSGNTYNITVGSGGAGGVYITGGGTNGGNGGDTTFLGQTAIGGGGGGGRINVSGYNATDGGSGGGGGNESTSTSGGAGTPGQGYPGGNGYNSGSSSAGGGGGGAGGAGINATSGTGGGGGAAVSKSITGSAVAYCGGGSGIDNTPTPSLSAGINGYGGNGGYQSAGANGSIGAVIISSDLPYVSATGSPTLTMNGSLYVYTFTSNGSITW